MATTTPNFGWPVPTSTDLVKDGATAIEALGDGIDTSMVDLKGGLTGQVLAKATNADMDFDWVTSDDANAIQNTQLTAKGALITAFSSATPATLTVGANGETLVADSSTSTGLRYQGSMAGGRNACINGGFDIWQRGTSFTVGAAFPYTADRWQVIRGGVVAGMTVTRQATADTTNLPFIQYCARVQRDSGNTSTQYLEITESFESFQSIPLAGKQVTLSFYARKGADYTAASDAFNYRLETGTGTDQNLVTAGYTGQTAAINATATLTTSWQRFSTTVTLASTVTEMGVRFRYTPVGTASTNDFFEITGVQVEVGAIPTQFSRAGGTIQGELAACQRYYIRWTGGAAYHPYGMGFATSTTAASVLINAPVQMRTAPTAIEYSTIYTEDYAGTSSTAGTPALANIGPITTRVNLTGLSGMTAGRGVYIFSNNDANGYLAFTAEL
jgi:hypothetical protein